MIFFRIGKELTWFVEMNFQDSMQNFYTIDAYYSFAVRGTAEAKCHQAAEVFGVVVQKLLINLYQSPQFAITLKTRV